MLMLLSHVACVNGLAVIFPGIYIFGSRYLYGMYCCLCLVFKKTVLIQIYMECKSCDLIKGLMSGNR